jgi:D-alanine-D-alanine ligase
MKIAIITGGTSAERDVSIRSAENVKNVIDFAEVTTFIFPEDTNKFLGNYKSFNVVIPVIHGVGGEDGSLQGFLKTLGINYIFSDITAHAIAIDKRITKKITSTLGINVAEKSESFPLFAKPNFGGSSVASKLCNTREELNALISQNPNVDFILEEPIIGREFTVGVVECRNEETVLPVIEIITTGSFFDFESKYNPNKLATEICPANIDSNISNELQRQALAIHKSIGVRHISRSDFIVTPENKIYFLEINTIPGMTDTSLIPKMLKEARLSLNNLLREWCKF